ncbi:4Fe-4S binding protein [Azospirillum sp. YIM B02556]|uniref:4Fe-4S binding protein n=1 Tax=Azospirillum endophyticum TaxID=2800326 RepID=A0ABS1FC52_9PROT|nr:4Fe-4S dicluster domain-containing protein [Azospirillum endophyticum]MBK1841010.1 4Fe-4S binding protein [Azospirillum endophyticum]
MNMLMLLLRNLARGPSTDAFPFGDTFTPERLRGRIRFDPELCTGCRLCAHVCAGDAIHFDETDEGLRFTLWHNTCTFCGLCEHYCQTKAIHLTDDWHLAHLQQDKYAMIEQGVVAPAACAGCGCRMTAPVPALTALAYRAGNRRIEHLQTLCPDCRRKAGVTGGRS